MSKKFFCPNCGAAAAPEDKFCLNCGTNLKEGTGVPTPPAQPVTQQPPTQHAGPYAPAQAIPAAVGVPRSSYIQMKAPLSSRCVALLIDNLIYNFCPPLWCFRDVIPEKGKSFGKSMLNLKVVDYDTGLPISVGQSCIRTICLGVCFGFDYIWPLFNDEGRRIGDYIAGTIVLEDRG